MLTDNLHHQVLSNFEYRALALAGVFRSAFLVNALSHTGILDKSGILEQPAFENNALSDCVMSIFCTSPVTPMDVIGSIKKVSSGLITLTEQFDSDSAKRNMDIARYVVNILFLERRLAKNPATLATLASGIELAIKQAGHFSPGHQNVIANLASLYSKTISQLGPRIMVSGDEHFLSNPHTANQVRTLLLSGIRCAVLWHQLGARRWHILFNRTRYVGEARYLLSHAHPE